MLSHEEKYWVAWYPTVTLPATLLPLRIQRTVAKKCSDCCMRRLKSSLSTLTAWKISLNQVWSFSLEQSTDALWAWLKFHGMKRLDRVF